MNAIRQLYINSGLITEDGYVKVNDNLWVKSGPYEKKSWYDTDKSILPTKEELHEIYLKVQELIQIQENCGLKSFQQISKDRFPWTWSSTEYNSSSAWCQRVSDGGQGGHYKSVGNWVVPIRRNP